MLQVHPTKLTITTVDPTKSRSYKALDQLPFNQTYIDGAGAQGIYATDDLSFAGITLRNATFGIAETPGYNTGFMGIGPDPDLYARKPLKKNISSTLDSLVAAEVTKSRLLSLYLDEISSSSGSIVFGGVDESKFDTSAGLVTLDILADPGTGAYDFYLIQMTNLSITSAGQSRALPISFSPSIPWMPTLVDSGASTVLVPPQIFSAINSYANAISPPSFDGAYGFPCSASQNETLKNTFLSWTPGDPLNPSVSITYNISLAELVVPFYVIGTTTPQTLNMDGEDTEVCLFGVQPSYSELDGLSVIGDPFLRRMYVVFDQDSREISFGYPVFNVEDSKVVEVLKVSDSPYAKKTESQSDADTLNKSLLNGFNATTSAPSGTSTAAVQTANAAAGLGVPHMGISTLVAAVMVFAAASGFAIGM